MKVNRRLAVSEDGKVTHKPVKQLSKINNFSINNNKVKGIKKMTKRISKLISMLLAAVMVLSMAMTGLAAEINPLASSPTTKGSITISNATEDATYSIYKIFDLTYASDESGNPTSYSYTVAKGWEEFFTTGVGADYFTFDTVDGVMYVKGANFESDSDDAAAFAQAALAYAKENEISATSSAKAGDSETVKFTNLDLGYYLVDTTVGSLCNLTTTDPDASIADKQTPPVPEKTVKDTTHKEDGTTGVEEESDQDSADIGDELQYTITIKSLVGNEKLKVYDTMTEGLTLENDSFTITYVPASGDPEELIAGTEYTIEFEKTEGEKTYTFIITFSDTWLAAQNFTANDYILITYKATVNEKAVQVNENDAFLKYGDDWTLESEPSHTETDVFGFNLEKIDGNGNMLEGATFNLIDESNVTLEFVINTEDTYTVYDAADDPTNEEQHNSTITAGSVSIFGLEAGKYILSEVNAPDGYNKLTYDIAIMITDSGTVYYCNLTDGKTLENVGEDEWKLLSDSKVTVENNAGTRLPSTGGMGTSLFYIIGAVLVLGAATLLITKKRLDKE